MFEKIVAYCLQKVGFAETDAAVNEEGIVFPAGIFRDGLCGGKRKLVGFALHKLVESVFFAEGGRSRFFLFRRAVDDETDFGNGVALFFEILGLFVLDYDFDIGDERVE